MDPRTKPLTSDEEMIEVLEIIENCNTQGEEIDAFVDYFLEDN